VKVFVSYSRRDTEFVERLDRDLTALGYDTWVDLEDIVGSGQDRWRRSIVSAIRGSEAMVLVLSPNSIHSANVERELSVAADNGKRVIPVIYRPCELPDAFVYELAGVQHIDFSVLAFEEGVRQLAAQLGPSGTLATAGATPNTVALEATPDRVTVNSWRQPRVFAIAGVALAVLLAAAVVLATTGGDGAGSIAPDTALPEASVDAKITVGSPETTTSPVTTGAITAPVVEVTTSTLAAAVPTRPLSSAEMTADASSVLPDDVGCDGTCNYDPSKAIDGDLTTAWAEGVDGAGIGEFITVRFAAPVVVRVVSIAPGWQRVDKPCLFVRSHRPATMSLQWEDGTRTVINLTDERETRPFDVAGPPTSSLTLTIDDVYPVEDCGGFGAVDDTMISEIGIAVDATTPVLVVPPVTKCVRANIDNAAVRTGPGTENLKVTEIPPGTCGVEVIDMANDSLGVPWYHVRFNGFDGWSAVSLFKQ
jgi:hypothetical protein